MRGIPTATVCTSEFVFLGQAEAEALGMPGLPILVVPHPIGGINPEGVKARADAIVEEVVAALTRPREVLLQHYRGLYAGPPKPIRHRPLFR